MVTVLSIQGQDMSAPLPQPQSTPVPCTCLKSREQQAPGSRTFPWEKGAQTLRRAELRKTSKEAKLFSRLLGPGASPEP